MPKQENLKSSKIPLLSFSSPQNFQQIEQKNPEILHFHFFIFLQDCVCDVIFMWEWGWKPSKWRLPSCSNSWLSNEISREPFGALRSASAHFFAFFALFHLSLTYFLSGVVLWEQSCVLTYFYLAFPNWNLGKCIFSQSRSLYFKNFQPPDHPRGLHGSEIFF